MNPTYPLLFTGLDPTTSFSIATSLGQVGSSMKIRLNVYDPVSVPLEKKVARDSYELLFH
jgi:hypothetical protein